MHLATASLLDLLETNAEYVAAARSPEGLDGFQSARASPLACARLLIFQLRLPTAGHGAAVALLPTQAEGSPEPGIGADYFTGESESPLAGEGAARPVPASVNLSPRLWEQASSRGRRIGFAAEAELAYAGVAAAAAEVGMVIDVFSFGERYLGLHAVGRLADGSGGRLFHYAANEPGAASLLARVCKFLDMRGT